MKRLKLILPILAVILLSGCKKVFFEEEPANNPEALFENVWETFNTDYAIFDERGVDWDQQYDIYRSQVSSSTTDSELETVLQQLLGSLDDGHVSLSVPNKPVFNGNQIINQRIDNELFNIDLIKNNYLEPGYEGDYDEGNLYGWIGNVGYWAVKFDGDNLEATTDILNQFSSADGLILDLRHNQGGDFTRAYSNFGPFTSQVRYTHRSKTKNGTGPNDFSSWYVWNVSPAGTHFNKPIVLLTDRYTISAGERFTLALRTLPNLTQMGDTTSGALSTKIGKEMANGWFYSVSTQKIESHDGQYFEGVGIPPQIYVKNTITEINAGQDKTLEEAISQF